MQHSINGSYSTILALNTVFLLVALGSIFLSMRSIYRGIRNSFKVRDAIKAIPPNRIFEKTGFSGYDEMPIKVKFAAIPYWSVWNLVACSLVAISCILSLAYYSGTDIHAFFQLYNTILGFAVFMTSVTIIRYFEFSRKLNVLVSTLRLSFGRTMAFLISILPIFFGFVLCAVSMFSPYTTRFASVDLSAVSLFAILQGDDVHETFNEMTRNIPEGWLWISRAFLYTYTLFASKYFIYRIDSMFTFNPLVCAVLNVFIFLIEDAFIQARKIDAQNKQEKSLNIKDIIKLLDDEGKDLVQSEIESEYMPLISEEPVETGVESIPMHSYDSLLEQVMQKQREIEMLLRSARPLAQ